MAENDSISTNELKSLIIQLASEIAGLDSKVTGFSEQILSEVKRGVGIKTEFSTSKQEASISENLDDNVGKWLYWDTSSSSIYFFFLLISSKTFANFIIL